MKVQHSPYLCAIQDGQKISDYREHMNYPISIAVDGRLSRFLDLKSVERTLIKLYLTNVEEQNGNWWDGLKKVFKKGGFYGSK